MPGPVLAATPRPGVKPKPQNHVPNRTGMGAPDASAVPLVFRKQSRNGSDTPTAAPFTRPRQKFATGKLAHERSFTSSRVSARITGGGVTAVNALLSTISRSKSGKR